MRGWISACLALLGAVSLPCSGQNLPDSGWVALDYDAAKAPADNPLKGFVPFSGGYDTFPHSMEFDYVGFAALMSGPNTFTFESGLEPLLNEIAGRGHQAIIRVYLDYPDDSTSIPQFLLDGGLQTTAYDGDSGAGRSPNYDDENLVQALLAFIAAYGERYDGDPRLGFVQIGLLGHWGEWHTYPEEELFPSTATQNRILTAFDTAFSTTPILVSQDVMGQSPMPALGTRDIGFHDDDFTHATLPTMDFHFWSRMLENSFDTRWRSLPNGGEVQPDYQQVVFDEPTGAPEDFAPAVRTTHVSWLLYHQAFEGEDGGSNGWDATKRARAVTGARLTGYELYVSQVNLPDATADGTLSLGVRIRNKGLAPFYYDWPFALTATRTGQSPVVLGAPAWSLRGIAADDTDHEFTFVSTVHSLAQGDYAIHLSVPNPLPGGSPLRFANTSQGALGVLLGTLSVTGSGEGEGDLESIADALLTDFDSLDLDESGGLSLAEARVSQAALSPIQFNELDGNKNGEVSEAELEAQLSGGGAVGCNLPSR